MLHKLIVKNKKKKKISKQINNKICRLCKDEKDKWIDEFRVT